MAEGDTLPKLLRQDYEKYGDRRIALRKKDFGIWNEYTWKDYYEKVKYFSLGLVSLGLEAGEKVSIIGDNDPEYYWAEFATQTAGGTPVPIYSDAMPTELIYIVGHSDSTFVVAKDQEQVDKILQIRGDIPKLRKVIYWDEKGLWNYDEPILTSLEQVMELGRRYEETHPGVFEESTERIKEDDLALIMYTSGTTGVPKGVMLTHKNMVFNAETWIESADLTKKDSYLSYMSPGWITEQVMGVTGGTLSGFTVNFCEKPETIQQDIREVGPTIMFYGTRLWESVASTIQSKISDTTSYKRFLYHLCLPIGYKMFQLKVEERKKPNLLWEALHKVAWLALFRPLLDKLGLMKARCVYTAGAVLSPEIFRFIHALGLNIKQLYGATEIAMPIGHQDYIKHGTVGQPFPEVEVKISDEGEILMRSPGTFIGYYKNPEVTNKTLIDGWFHTGDAGFFDEDGQLVYTDRVSELLELADGTKFSPQFIESTLRFSPNIADVMVLGGKGKAYVTAVIIIDYVNVGKWAESHRIAYTTFTDLSQKPQVYDLIQKEVERVNSMLPPSARVKKFLNLHKEFDPDEAELTRTRKLRRTFMEERYKELVDTLYSDNKEIMAETMVKYRDGRVGKVTATVNIRFLDEEGVQ